MKPLHILIFAAIAAVIIYYFMNKNESAAATDQQLKLARIPGRKPVVSARYIGNRDGAVKYFRNRGGWSAGCSFVELGNNTFEVTGC